MSADRNWNQPTTSSHFEVSCWKFKKKMKIIIDVFTSTQWGSVRKQRMLPLLESLNVHISMFLGSFQGLQFWNYSKRTKVKIKLKIANEILFPKTHYYPMKPAHLPWTSSADFHLIFVKSLKRFDFSWIFFSLELTFGIVYEFITSCHFRYWHQMMFVQCSAQYTFIHVFLLLLFLAFLCF